MIYFLTFLLAIGLVFFANWQYRLLMILLGMLLWRKRIVACSRKLYLGLLAAWGLAFVALLPAVGYGSLHRTGLVYFDGDEVTSFHLPTYLLNVIFPEEEVLNFGSRLNGFAPVNQGLINQYRDEMARGRRGMFFKPYHRLDVARPQSGAIAQTYNMLFGTQLRPVYVARPKNYDASQNYPVVLFMHGYLGNWQLYQGFFNQLEGCIVVSVGTIDWSGLYDREDFAVTFDKILPWVEKNVPGADTSRLHLIGLSNGGSASNLAMQAYSKHFKSVTFLSTDIRFTGRSKTRVVMVGGTGDNATYNFNNAYRHLQANGTPVTMMLVPDENHYIMLCRPDEVLATLQDNISN